MAAEPADGLAQEGAPASATSGGSVFAALADPTRRRMLEVLVEVGRASATTLAEHLPISRQAVVKHLHVLEAAGLVRGLRTGREVLYVPRKGTLQESARWLTDLSDAWEARHGHATRGIDPIRSAPA